MGTVQFSQRKDGTVGSSLAASLGSASWHFLSSQDWFDVTLFTCIRRWRQITLEKLQWLLFTGGTGSLLGGEMKLEGVEGSRKG